MPSDFEDWLYSHRIRDELSKPATGEPDALGKVIAGTIFFGFLGLVCLSPCIAVAFILLRQ